MNPKGMLLTDLYQLAMLEAYFDAGMEDEAVFELFVRELPPGYGYLAAAGLEQVLETLEGAQFSDEELGWIAGSGRFSPELAEYLAGFRFTGDVHAVPEGTLFFPDEPILRVSAPIPQAQLLETRFHHRLQAGLDRLPPGLAALDAEPAYPVAVCGGGRALGREADRLIERRAAAGSR